MNRTQTVLGGLATLGGLTLSRVAWAQGASIEPMAVASSVLYGLLGIVLAVVGYKVFEFVLPFDVTKELSVDDNAAVGVVMAAVILGVSIIMAAAIHG